MIRMNLPRLLIVFVCVISWGLISFRNYPSRAWSHSSRPVNKSINIVQVSFIRSLLAQEGAWDFTKYGRSGNRDGGASRGDCLGVQPGQPHITALMPTSNSGTTVAPRPTFWFYVPYSPQEATSGEFVLLNRQWNVISQIPFRLPETPGLVRITIPATEPELEINKWYHWFFKLFCEGEESSSSSPDLVRGWVQRIELSSALNDQLNAASPQEYLVYANNGIWYDALAHLAELRLNNASDAALADWTKLLGAKGVDFKGVDLEKFSQEPLVGSVILD